LIAGWGPGVRISRKGGTTVGMRMKRGGDLAGLPATRQPKEQKDRVHAKIDLTGRDSVLVRWGKAAGKERHKVETYEATVVEIDRAQGPKPVQVKFRTGEAAWVVTFVWTMWMGAPNQPREASQTSKS
jgi:hypothetical protein